MKPLKLDDFRYYLHGPMDSEGHSKAPWLIFLHGLLGSAANWRRITPAFETQYRILTFDQRGHGHSAKPDAGYAVEDYAGDLLLMMDALKIERAVLIGHSMGGRNALTFTHLHPSRVEKLVVEDIGPETTDEGGGGLIRLLRSVPVPFASKLQAKEYLLNDLGDAKLGQFFYASMRVVESGETTWSFDLEKMVDTIDEGRKINRWPEWQSLKTPTLVIRGERSKDLPRAEFEKMLAMRPTATGVEIAGAGHWVHFDKPHEFIEALKKFL